MKIATVDLLRARPRAVARHEAVVLDGEVVVYAGGEIHTLNTTATAIWQRCDGSVAVDALVVELASSYRAPMDGVRDDVMTTVLALVERGLIELETLSAPPVDQPDSKPVLQTIAACSGCGAGPGYEQQLLIDAGAVVVSVGCDSEIADALEAALGPRALGRRDISVDRPSYGVVIPRPSRQRGRTDLARLHRGPDVLLASRDPERVLRALVTQISIHDSPAGHTILEGLTVGANRRVVIVPAPVNRARFEHAAHRFGLAVSDPPATTVDIGSPIAVVGAPWFGLDFEPLRVAAATRQHRDGEPTPLAWGSYDLMALAVSGRPDIANVVGELGPSVGVVPPTRASLEEQLRFIGALPIVSSPTLEQIAELTR